MKHYESQSDQGRKRRSWDFASDAPLSPGAHAFSLRLSIESVAVDPAAVVSVAVETGLTGYEASYLWLAREFRADFVTLDAALSAAAGS